MTRRSDALHLAVLGLLHETPLHGYELRSRLDLLIGALRRRISFGSLYPALRALEAGGWITGSDDEPAVAGRPLPTRRRRVVYRVTPAGERHLAELLAVSGPAAWEDEQFDVHFAFFARTDPGTRVRILEGRRTRVLERLDRARASSARLTGRRDTYLVELARHGLESLEREITWLDGLVERERAGHPARTAPGPGNHPGPEDHPDPEPRPDRGEHRAR